MFARQALYYFSHVRSTFAFILFFRQDLPLPPEQLGLQALSPRPALICDFEKFSLSSKR
jgi:hypothetical protein